MSKLGLGPVGMTVQFEADGRHLDEAAALEGLGYSAVLVRGGQLDSLSRIAEVVQGYQGGAGGPGHHPGGRLRAR